MMYLIPLYSLFHDNDNDNDNRKLAHPHIVYYMGVYTSAEGGKYIVMEYLNRGSLLQVVQEERDQLTLVDLLAM